MIITIAGEPRTWFLLPFTISECTYCGSHSFKRSKIAKTWYCSECNEAYGDEKPWYPAIECSKHGKQVRYDNNEDAYWCTACEEEDLCHTTPQT